MKEDYHGRPYGHQTVKNYCKQFYVFLFQQYRWHLILVKLQKPIQEKINWIISTKKNKIIVESLPKKKTISPDGFTGKFLFKRHCNTNYRQPLPPPKKNKRKRRGKNISHVFLRGQNYPITKGTQHHKKVELQKISLMNIDTKFLNKVFVNQIQQYIETKYHKEVGFFLGMQGWYNEICHING